MMLLKLIQHASTNQALLNVALGNNGWRDLWGVLAIAAADFVPVDVSAITCRCYLSQAAVIGTGVGVGGESCRSSGNCASSANSRCCRAVMMTVSAAGITRRRINPATSVFANPAAFSSSRFSFGETHSSTRTDLSAKPVSFI